MIKIEKANKYFNRFKKNQIHAIDNTTLEMEDKGFVAILGASGCGKTTLLNAIGGLDKLNSGKIYVNGKKINSVFSSRTDTIRNLNIGYIFQKFYLIDDMTVFDNVALVLKMIGIKDKKEIKKRVEYVLSKVGMEQYKNRFPTMLSGGQKQRIAIARAIVKNPNIIIADEPTGNLDSKNSLEVMKIIKSISEEKLVVLVTHERELAEFFSTRIIEVVDGKVVSDKKNEHDEDLDYKLDNKIYLKDMSTHKKIDEEKCNIDIYSDSNKKLDITIVVRNGNIYIKDKKNIKIEVVDDNSNIEFVNDNYKKISKSEQDKYKIDLEQLKTKNKKLKYKSIYNIIFSTILGFKKVFNYPFMKKMLLIGFFVASMFVSYAVYNIFGITRINDTKFITEPKENVRLETKNVTLDKYNEIANMENVNYVLPTDAMVSIKLPLDYFYQSKNLEYDITGALASNELITKKDIIYGNMPQNDNEIVVDVLAFKMFMAEFKPKQLGKANISDFVDQIVKIENMQDMKICGFVDKKSPTIYAFKNKLEKMIYNSKMSMNNREDEKMASNSSDKFLCYLDNMSNITLKEGRAPDNDYEVLVNIASKESIKLGSELETKVFGNKLKVVGYYDSRYKMDSYFVNENTIRYSLIENTDEVTIYPKDKEAILNVFKENGSNAQDVYNINKEKYLKVVHDKVMSTVVMSSIIFAISLIEIYLMMRSSFLSRVKEVGILRAIGVKKRDIKKMFLGEILSISIIASMPGFIFMTFVINSLTKISFFAEDYLVNIKTVGLSLALILIINIVVGLLPLYKILRKTPAEILSRTDVD